jgi:hypothetical protein
VAEQSLQDGGDNTLHDEGLRCLFTANVYNSTSPTRKKQEQHRTFEMRHMQAES